MTGEQLGGDDDAMQLHYCVGAAADLGAPHQSTRVPATDTPVFTRDKCGYFLQGHHDFKQWIPYTEPSITAKILKTQNENYCFL
jgi:hypothetical protein